MKKFMFSAVALVAFSFAGMASEVEEAPEKVFNGGTKMDICAQRSNQAYQQALLISGDEDLATNVAVLVTLDCLING